MDLPLRALVTLTENWVLILSAYTVAYNLL